jgi:hypothetical protein
MKYIHVYTYIPSILRHLCSAASSYALLPWWTARAKPRRRRQDNSTSWAPWFARSIQPELEERDRGEKLVGDGDGEAAAMAGDREPR